jgi:hypothetical protein
MMLTRNEISTPTTLNPLQRVWSVIQEEKEAYIYLNILYYGLVVLGMVYVTFFNPGLQETLMQAAGQAFTEGPLGAIGNAYGGGQVIHSMILTFIVNLFLGSMLEMSLPSLIIPFSGLLMGVYRAILWGLLLSPSNPGLAGPMIPHSLTLLIEGQAYILVMLAIYIHGKAFVRPEAYGVTSRLQGYLEGLRRTGWIYILVAILLAIAAVYEALEVIYLAPLF